MPGIFSGAMVAATAVTMVGLDAVEYVGFSIIGKQLKQFKGDKNTMLTASQFIAQAKAKKAAATVATTNVIEKAAGAAATVKDAVVGALPASNKSVDKLSELTAVLVASLEQRVDFLEDQVGSGVQVDPEQLTERVQQILASLNPPKAKKEKPQDNPQVKVSEVGVKVSKATLGAAPSAPKAEPAVRGTRPKASKPKLGGRYEAPQDWSNIPQHD